MTATLHPTPAIATRWIGFSVVLAATLMNLLDSTVVTVAAPAIQADLGASFTALQWVAAGYTLALAVGLLTGARLGDMFGRKRMLMIGVAGFTITSVACAFAWTPEILIGARVLQGLCAAVMIPQSFGMIRDLFGPKEIGKAFAAFGPAIGLATILGPIVAGLLIEADVFGTGWKMIFLMNLPLGIFALVVGNKVLPANPPSHPGIRLDAAGMALAGAGMFLLVYPLMQGRELGWPKWTFAMMAASVVVLAVFARHQLRRKASGRTPLVELAVFARRSYSSGVVFVIVFFGAIVGFSLAVGMFLQLGLGHSAMRASMVMAAWAVGAFLGSGFGATMMHRLGRRILHIGLVLMAAGVGGVWLVLQNGGAGLPFPLVVFGAGMGMIFIPLFDVIMGEVADDEVGSAAGSLEALQQLGSSLGIAVLGTVFFSVAGVDFRGSVEAASITALLTLGLTAVAFGLGFLLPKKARAAH